MAHPVRAKWAKWVVLAVLLILAAAALSACGGSSSSSSSESTAASAETSEAAETSSETTAEESGESGESQAVAEATAAVEENSNVSAPIELTMVENEIPKGANVAILSVNIPGNQVIVHGIEAAGKKLQWHMKNYLPPITPEGWAGALTSILQQKPEALIMFLPFPASSFRTQLNEFKAAGIPVIAMGATEYPVGGSSPIVASGALPLDFAPQGQLMAQLTIHEEGEGTAVALVNDPSVPAWKVIVEEMKKTTEAAGGTFYEVEVGLAEAPKTGPQTIVSFLQAHPEVKWLWMVVNQYALGLPQALKAAGISVNTGTDNGESIDVEMIEKGQQTATIVGETESIGWRLIDATARAISGSKIVQTEIPENNLVVTKENLSEVKDAKGFPHEEQAFLKAWGLG